MHTTHSFLYKHFFGRNQRCTRHPHAQPRAALPDLHVYTRFHNPIQMCSRQQACLCSSVMSMPVSKSSSATGISAPPVTTAAGVLLLCFLWDVWLLPAKVQHIISYGRSPCHYWVVLDWAPSLSGETALLLFATWFILPKVTSH